MKYLVPLYVRAVWPYQARGRTVVLKMPSSPQDVPGVSAGFITRGQTKKIKSGGRVEGKGGTAQLMTHSYKISDLRKKFCESPTQLF